MLRWRLATAVVLLPVIAGVIAAGRWVILAALLAVVGFAAYELYEALKPLPFAAAFAAGAAPVALSGPFGVPGALGGALLALPLVLFWIIGRRELRLLVALLGAFLMALWVGVPLAHLGLLAGLSQGRLLVALALVGTWVSDAGAYSCGRLAGRHLLAPDLSPKKTVEGAAGGLVLTVVVVGAGAPHFLDLSTAQAVLAGAVISVFGQAGDLFESALKRTLEVKDLGRLLPGHGGMLDRVDSLLFAAPALYYLLLFL